MSKYLRRSIIGLVIIVLLALFVHFKSGSAKLAPKVDDVVRVHCPIQSQTCLINLAKGIKLELSLSPKGFPALEPLTLELRSNEIDFHKITHFDASFEGLEMEMGRHALTLSSSINSNMLQATGLIPLCPMDPLMVWVLNIQFQYQNKVTLLTFEVASQAHAN